MGKVHGKDLPQEMVSTVDGDDRQRVLSVSQKYAEAFAACDWQLIGVLLSNNVTYNSPSGTASGVSATKKSWKIWYDTFGKPEVQGITITERPATPSSPNEATADKADPVAEANVTFKGSITFQDTVRVVGNQVVAIHRVADAAETVMLEKLREQEEALRGGLVSESRSAWRRVMSLRGLLSRGMKAKNGQPAEFLEEKLQEMEAEITELRASFQRKERYLREILEKKDHQLAIASNREQTLVSKLRGKVAELTAKIETLRSGALEALQKQGNEYRIRVERAVDAIRNVEGVPDKPRSQILVLCDKVTFQAANFNMEVEESYEEYAKSVITKDQPAAAPQYQPQVSHAQVLAEDMERHLRAEIDSMARERSDLLQQCQENAERANRAQEEAAALQEKLDRLLRESKDNPTKEVVQPSQRAQTKRTSAPTAYPSAANAQQAAQPPREVPSMNGPRGAPNHRRSQQGQYNQPQRHQQQQQQLVQQQDQHQHQQQQQQQHEQQHEQRSSITSGEVAQVKKRHSEVEGDDNHKLREALRAKKAEVARLKDELTRLSKQLSTPHHSGGCHAATQTQTDPPSPPSSSLPPLKQHHPQQQQQGQRAPMPPGYPPTPPEGTAKAATSPTASLINLPFLEKAQEGPAGKKKRTRDRHTGVPSKSAGRAALRECAKVPEWATGQGFWEVHSQWRKINPDGLPHITIKEIAALEPRLGSRLNLSLAAALATPTFSFPDPNHISLADFTAFYLQLTSL